jgi:predicted DNA-binding transcriptional regulator AlpA
MNQEIAPQVLGQPVGKSIRKANAVNPSGVQLLRRRDVLAKCGFSRTQLYLMTKEESATYDPTFPKGFTIGPDPFNKKPKFWLESEVDAWISAKATARF